MSLKDFPKGKTVKIEELCKCKKRKEIKYFHLKKWSELPTEYHLFACPKHEKKLIERIFKISNRLVAGIEW